MRNSSPAAARHVYIIGAKSIGQYGGYESFILHLLREHAGDPKVRYHVTLHENGPGCMDPSKYPEIERISDREFLFRGAHCVLIRTPETPFGSQAVLTSVKALRWACRHIEENGIRQPVVYILASRIGPFEKSFVKRIHRAGGRIFQNPDGQEYRRRKWPAPVRFYWKVSEAFSVKHADLVVCDSRAIRAEIRKQYRVFRPATTYIPYGSDLSPSPLADTDPRYMGFLASHNLRDRQYLLMVGRLVPENNYDTVIREFTRSRIPMELLIVSTEDRKYLAALEKAYHFREDPRIRFAGPVYDEALLGKLRENAFAYIHGHEVGGTNPSLLESLGKTKLNLLCDVPFNRETAGETALYWTKEEGNLTSLLDSVMEMPPSAINALGAAAKERMRRRYSWGAVARAYRALFTGETPQKTAASVPGRTRSNAGSAADPEAPVAILLASCNGEKYLAEQLESILRQSHKNWKIFLSDDGSDDAAPEIIDRYCAQYPDRMVRVPVPAEGSADPAAKPAPSSGPARTAETNPSAARLGPTGNFAYLQQYVTAHYDFPYYMFCDQDDVWMEDKIRVTLAAMQRAESSRGTRFVNKWQNGPGSTGRSGCASGPDLLPVLVHTDLTVADAKLRVIADSFFRYRAIRPDYTDLRHLLVQNNATGCTMLWNRALNDVLGDSLTKDGVFRHDWWLSLTASAFGKIVPLRRPTVLYRQHGNNVVGATKTRSIGFIIDRLRDTGHVRRSLRGSSEQAAAFLRIYGRKLTEADRRTAAAWADLYQETKTGRLLTAVRGGYFKQGLIQVIGELLFL